MTRPSGISCVLFDFDGTLTDIEHHAPLYEAAFREDLARRARIAPADFARSWAEAVARIEAAPAELGWTFGGYVVAPASADPYLFANAAARLVLERDGRMDAAERAEAVYESYRASYRKIPTRFREDAAAVLDALLAREARVYVVTNAFADDVNAKLDTLSLARRDKLVVHGDARKFEIIAPTQPDPRFDALPDEIRVAGLTRPVLLKRGRYFDVLRRIWEETSGGPASTLMCGDVYELDLALPDALGAHVHLVVHARTLPHERAVVQTLARGGVGLGLGSVLARVT